jgi:hypothetical protein
MRKWRSEDLRDLCTWHGLLAAILLLQPDPVLWLGSLIQADYVHLLLLTQTQTMPLTIARLDAVQLTNQPVLVHSQLLANETLALLVFPFETRLKELDRRATAFLQEIQTRNAQYQSQSLLDGLTARQVEPSGSTDADLLALFSAMPEANPSNEATQPFHVTKLSVQTLEKSIDTWKQIF